MSPVYVNIAFRNRKLQRLCSSEDRMVRELGMTMARRLMLRLQQLEAALHLAEMALLKQGRLHELAGDRDGQLSLDLVHPLRLILVPDHEPIPRLPEGGLDLGLITAVLILDITDTH